jgi:hypothetical protein
MQETTVSLLVLKEAVGITTQQQAIASESSRTLVTLIQECSATISPTTLPADGRAYITISGQGFEPAAQYQACFTLVTYRREPIQSCALM